MAPSLFISSYEGARDTQLLRQHGITCVVNATPDLPNPGAARTGIEYVRVAVDDMPSAQLSAHFEYISQKINQVSFIDQSAFDDNDEIIEFSQRKLVLRRTFSA